MLSLIFPLGYVGPTTVEWLTGSIASTRRAAAAGSAASSRRSMHDLQIRIHRFTATLLPAENI